MRLVSLLLLLTSSACAAPLIQSTASVAQGNFCKAYGCQLVQKKVLFPETTHNYTYDYRIKGGSLVVGRLYGINIHYGALEVPAKQWNSPAVRDFFRNFIGLTPEPEGLRSCTKRAMASGSAKPTPIASGLVGKLAYTADCQAARAGVIRFVVSDSRDLLM